MKKLTILITILLISYVGISQEVQASFMHDLLGMSGRDFTIASIWAIFGIAINLFSDITRRDVPSTHSPQKFSFGYWWQDNYRRVIISFLLTPVALVGVEQLFGVELSRFVAFGIGYGSDHLVEIIKRKGVIKGADYAE